MATSPTPNSSLIGVIMPADDVLVDLVHEDHEAEHPHRLGEHPDDQRLPAGRNDLRSGSEMTVMPSVDVAAAAEAGVVTSPMKNEILHRRCWFLSDRA